jgi:hypothetical protein
MALKSLFLKAFIVIVGGLKAPALATSFSVSS